MTEPLVFNSPASITAEIAFADYAVAAKRAQATLSISDGIAAGRAWRRFLEIFEQRPGGIVVDFHTARRPRYAGGEVRP